MNRLLIGYGTVFISLLLISTATAIPQTYSKPVMDVIETKEKNLFFEEKLENVIESTGIIDWIIQLLQMLLNLISDLIQFVLDLFQIVNLIDMIISALNQLVNVIAQFIQAFIDLFNPAQLYQ